MPVPNLFYNLQYDFLNIVVILHPLQREPAVQGPYFWLEYHRIHFGCYLPDVCHVLKNELVLKVPEATGFLQKLILVFDQIQVSDDLPLNLNQIMVRVFHLETRIIDNASHLVVQSDCKESVFLIYDPLGTVNQRGYSFTFVIQILKLLLFDFVVRFILVRLSIFLFTSMTFFSVAERFFSTLF